MRLDHPPPNLQPVLLALEPTSPILSTSMRLAHPPPNLQPALLARTTLNYPYPTSTILPTPVPLGHLFPDLQHALLALEPTSTILPAPMPFAHLAISSTFSPATCSCSPGTNLNCTTHNHATCSSSNLIPTSPATWSSSQGIKNSTILPNPMPLANQAILSTSSITTCYSSPRSNTKYPTHTQATCPPNKVIHLYTCHLNF
jgi:hypothetical protein